MEFLILAIAALAGTLISTTANNANNTANNRALRKEAEKQRQFDYSMWQATNSYNNPVNQMERLSAAGLNPNLVYTGGNVVGSSSSPAPKYDIPNLRPFTQNDVDMQGAGQMFLQGKQNAAQIEHLGYQNDVTKQQAITETLRQANLSVSNASDSFNLGLAQKLEENTLEAARENLNKLMQERKVLQQQIDFEPLKREMTQSQITSVNKATQKLQQTYNFDEFEQALKREGIYPNDPLWARIMARLLTGMGFSLNMLGGQPEVTTPPQINYY